MPAKRKITLKKKTKEVEKTPVIEENTVTTVMENEISDVEIPSGTTLQSEEKILFKKSDLQDKKEKSKVI
jgi:hypothetical protein